MDGMDGVLITGYLGEPSIDGRLSPSPTYMSISHGDATTSQPAPRGAGVLLDAIMNSSPRPTPLTLPCTSNYSCPSRNMLQASAACCHMQMLIVISDYWHACICRSYASTSAPK
jgi:hypothetical protein